MVFNFPRVKFTDKNGIFNQLKHIASEVQEAIEAAMTIDKDHLDDEIMDIGHAWETLVRMREENHRDMDVAQARVVIKNHERGYYDATN